MYAIKVELKLNNREKTLIHQHIGFGRFIYNYGLSIYNQIDHQEFKGGTSKKLDLIKKVFTNVTKKHPEYTPVDKKLSQPWSKQEDNSNGQL